MGGDRETIAKQTKTTDSGEVKECGEVRYHESGAEIHFHDDKKNIKVAIPSGVWFQLFQTLMSKTPNSITYTDPQNRSVLHVKTQYKKARAKKKKLAHVKTEMYIESATFDVVLTDLHQFTEVG